MSIKRFLVDALVVFSVSLVVMICVTFLWNLIVHRSSTADWEASIRFAISFGIIFSWIGARRSKEK
jgi:hypothetical protein